MMAAIQPIDEKPFVVSLHHARSGIISHFRRVADRFRILFFCLSRLQHGVHISTRTFFSRRQILRSSGPAQCFLRCRPSRLHRLRAGIRSGFLNQRHGRLRAPVIPLRLPRPKLPRQPSLHHSFSSKTHSASNPHTTIPFQIRQEYPLPCSRSRPIALSSHFARS